MEHTFPIYTKETNGGKRWRHTMHISPNKCVSVYWPELREYPEIESTHYRSTVTTSEYDRMNKGEITRCSKEEFDGMLREALKKLSELTE